MTPGRSGQPTGVAAWKPGEARLTVMDSLTETCEPAETAAPAEPSAEVAAVLVGAA